MSHRIVSLVLGSAICLGVAASGANAAMITFLHSGQGSGTINGVEFVRKNFTITGIGDTANREFDGADVFSIDHTSASITIADVGTFDFISGTRTYVNNSNGAAGFSRASIVGLDLFDSGEDPSLVTWDMLSSIGPLPGTGALLQWNAEDVDTSGGVLVFEPNAGVGGTFQAIVPAPASLGVLALGGMIATRRRR